MSPRNAIKIINIQKSYLVHFGPIRSIFSSSVHFGSIRSILVLYRSFCLLQLTLVLFSPPWSYSVHMSTLVLIYALVLFWSTSFPFCHILSIQSTSFHLCPLRSIFMHLHIRKGYVWIESSYSKSKFITKNIDLKYVISKILSIIFIVAILLLSHINVVFQFPFPAKFKWKSF